MVIREKQYAKDAKVCAKDAKDAVLAEGVSLEADVVVAVGL